MGHVKGRHYTIINHQLKFNKRLILNILGINPVLGITRRIVPSRCFMAKFYFILRPSLNACHFKSFKEFYANNLIHITFYFHTTWLFQQKDFQIPFRKVRAALEMIQQARGTVWTEHI